MPARVGDCVSIGGRGARAGISTGEGGTPSEGGGAGSGAGEDAAEAELARAPSATKSAKLRWQVAKNLSIASAKNAAERYDKQ